MNHNLRSIDLLESESRVAAMLLINNLKLFENLFESFQVSDRRWYLTFLSMFKLRVVDMAFEAQR